MTFRTWTFTLWVLLPACTSLERVIADTQVPNPSPRELHAQKGEDFDHATFTKVLQRFVDEQGRVDYPALAEAPDDLEAYLAQLEALDYGRLSRDAKLATLINAYNAFTLRLILDHLPTDSIRDIPKKERWEGRQWPLGGDQVTLSQIEHARLRAEFRDPRIHFAINCASESCPPLPRRAFETNILEAQLEEAARRVHDPASRWFSWNEKSRTVQLFRVYLWFHKDFEAEGGSVEAYAARFSPPLQAALASGSVKVRYLDYDWSLNASRGPR
ncbi:MAG: DUF547 domain-containing protein [Myxococcota bacterium]